MHEIDQQALNPESGAETTPEASPAIEEQTTQPTAETTTEASTEAAEEPKQERKQPESQRRIRELANERRQLQEQLDALTRGRPDPLQGDPWAAYNEGEITLDQLKMMTHQTAETIATQKVQQLEQRIMFSDDLRTVESKYPKLNPESPEYDRDYDDTISKLYQQSGGNMRLSDFVGQIETLSKRSAQKATQSAAASLRQQAADSGLTPTSDRPSTGTTKDALKAQAMQSGDWSAYFEADARESLNNSR
jgi:hypothetical protein